MYQLFLSGKISFEVHGTEDQVSEVMSDVKNGLAGFNIVYHEDDIDKIFEVRLSGNLEGIFEFKNTSPTSISVNLDGVVETFVRRGVINAIIKKSLPWRVESISSCYRYIEVPKDVLQNNIKLSKKR
jgi:hypothetical protein|tara:strand:+ start:158 stop:538 length:381 start_codon:yes stop_codon:yes gene_type:complete